MRIAIIGGTGFIGTAFASYCFYHGHDPVVIARSKKRRWLTGTYRRADASRPAGLTKALAGCETAVHAVWSTTPGESELDPTKDAANILTTISVMRACRDAGIDHVVFLSSGGTVYGYPRMLPIPESHPTDPISSYGVGKLCAERYVRQMGARSGMTTTIARLSNPYGPGQESRGLGFPAFGVVPALFHAAISGKPFTRYDRGSTTRDFVFIDDVARALDRICLAPPERHNVFNIGSGTGASIQTLSGMVAKTCKRRIRFDDRPAREFDVKNIVLDITKAGQELGWHPRVSLPNGLALLHLARHYRRLLGDA